MKDTAGLMTVEELATALNIKVSWIYTRTRMRGPDRIPFLKIGKYVRFSLPEVMAWLREGADSQNG